MEISFKNKVVLITGASRGLGAAAARLFAESGAVVLIHYSKNESAARKVLNELHGNGHSIISADLSEPDSIQNMVDEVLESYHRVDVLVNNAGIYDEMPDWIEANYQDWLIYWNRTIHTNLTGPANLSFLVVQSMLNRGGGKIVNITSRGAFRGEPDALPYGASKAGMNSVGQSMAKKLADKNIFVFTLAPGFFYSDMTTEILESDRGEGIKNQSPMKRVASTDEIARVILFLASDGNEYMTGSVVDMNGASYLR